MSKEENGGAAFPRVWREGESGEYWIEQDPGMTLRDYFAAKALPAIYADAMRECLISGFSDGWRIGVATEAYAIANAMLEARKK